MWWPGGMQYSSREFPVKVVCGIGCGAGCGERGEVALEHGADGSDARVTDFGARRTVGPYKLTFGF